MIKTLLIIAVACVVAYLLRRNFRRARYVLRTGDEHPDWDELGFDYFVAPWERKRMNRSLQKNEDEVQDIAE